MVAYFYCSSNVFEKQRIRYILGSLVKQIFSKIAATDLEKELDFLYSLYESDFYKGRSASRSFKNDFVGFIARSSGYFERIFVVIDGLDEVPHRESLLAALNEFRPGDKVNILAMSRPEEDIRAAFSGKTSMMIDETSVKHDISVYVKLEFSKGRLSEIKEDLRQEVVETLLEKGAAM